MKNKYVCLKPCSENSFPVMGFRVLGFETLREARRCKTNNDNNVVIAKIISSEIENWNRLTQGEKK